METNNRLMVVYDEQCRRQNVEQLHVKNKQTRSHEQGLHQATTASIKHGEQLEEMQPPTTVPADAGVQVVYGFQEVPKAPSFNGSTKVQMRKFLDQYETYASEVNIAQRAPLSVCIDPLSAEPKLTVDYLVAAIQPTAVRACVKERMKLNENRGPKKDARDIKRWLADYIHRYGEFEALMATRHRHVQNVASCDQDPQGWKDPKVVAVVIVDKVKGFVGPSHSVTEEATIDLRFETDAGPLMLTNVKCWVSTGVLPANVGDILLSRAIMYCTT
ncbi:hypothetical protein B5M09_011848 [Aphanomyces astaci]|uniref:Uncharacterized protein n=1 Tax=Aphanomyces astaci TaxID=112090 RepID=A0A3R7WQL4_APHAT|nr:hypothetical protein B5M09_011848 [Aphanomyces astaci]